MRIQAEPEWEDIAHALMTDRGTVLLIGATDSGKSTLAQYLIRRLVAEKIRATLIDSDIGQSSLGLPGTISMKTFNRSEDTEHFRPQRMIFIGALNPAKAIPAVIGGVKKMAEISKKRGVDLIVADTSGLISGWPGKTLKKGKIDILRPRHVLALQQHHELEHILTSCEGAHVHRMRPSKGVRARSREARIRYRMGKFRAYFRAAEVIGVPYKGMEFLEKRKDLDIRSKALEPGTLLGLNSGSMTRSLGLLIQRRRDGMLIKTPLRSLRWIKRIIVGDIVLRELVEKPGIADASWSMCMMPRNPV